MFNGVSGPIFFIFRSVGRQIEKRRLEFLDQLAFKECPLFPEQLNKGVGFIGLRRIAKGILKHAMLTTDECVEHGGGDGGGEHCNVLGEV